MTDTLPLTRAERRATERRPSRRRKAVIAGALAGVLGGTAGIGALLEHRVDLADFVTSSGGSSILLTTAYVDQTVNGTPAASPDAFITLDDPLPGDVASGTIEVTNEGATDALLSVAPTSAQVDTPLMLAEMTIDGVPATLWDGQAFHLGTIAAGQTRLIPVTLELPDDIETGDWEAAWASGALQLDVTLTGTQIQHNPAAATLGGLTGYTP